MRTEVTWGDSKIDLKFGKVLTLCGRASIKITDKGVIKLSKPYKCKKYLPRKYWVDPSAAEVMTEDEWSSEFVLKQGIVEFDILGKPLVIEAIEE